MSYSITSHCSPQIGKLRGCFQNQGERKYGLLLVGPSKILEELWSWKYLCQLLENMIGQGTSHICSAEYTNYLEILEGRNSVALPSKCTELYTLHCTHKHHSGFYCSSPFGFLLLYFPYQFLLCLAIFYVYF